MSSDQKEYEICKKRNHQKSGKRVTEGSGSPWEVCKYCTTWFRFVTKLEERNKPNEKE